MTNATGDGKPQILTGAMIREAVIKLRERTGINVFQSLFAYKCLSCGYRLTISINDGIDCPVCYSMMELEKVNNEQDIQRKLS